MSFLKAVVVLYVYARDKDREVQRWEGPQEIPAEQPDPLLLMCEGPEGIEHYLFALDRVEGDTAVYLPIATHRNQPLLSRLQGFRFRRVDS